MKWILAWSQIFLLLMVPARVLSLDTAQEQMKELAARASPNGVLQGRDGWLFLQEELEHLGNLSSYGEGVLARSQGTQTPLSDPEAAIVDFKEQLQVLGIELVFVPIPPKALIYPEGLPGGFGTEWSSQLARSYEEFYARLAAQGVQVVDMIPRFLATRGSGLLYCKTDSHFSGIGLGLVAEELGRLIRHKGWYSGLEKKKYRQELREIGIQGDLSLMQKSEYREQVALKFQIDQATGKAERPDPESPVLLLGDSHTLVFSTGADMHSRGAGLFDQLNGELGFAVDRMGVRGSGATVSRIKLYQRSRKDSSYLATKKIIIWCLSARELTGSGAWRKIPVAKK